MQALYDNGGRNERFIPVLLGAGSEQDIPLRLRSTTWYWLDRDYDALYRRLTRQPAVLAGPLGSVRRLEPLDPLAVLSEGLATSAGAPGGALLAGPGQPDGAPPAPRGADVPPAPAAPLPVGGGPAASLPSRRLRGKSVLPLAGVALLCAVVTALLLLGRHCEGGSGEAPSGATAPAVVQPGGRPETATPSASAAVADVAPWPPPLLPAEQSPVWVSVPGGPVTVVSAGAPSPAPVATVPDFEVTSRPVSVAHYLACVGQGRCLTPHWDDGLCAVRGPGGWNRRALSDAERPPADAPSPVTCVDWTQAREYCDFARARLLSEAEWLRVRFHQGPAAGGLVEWTHDCWHADLAQLPNNGAAWTVDCDDELRVVRNGAERLKSRVDAAASDTGFRCARSARGAR